MTHSHDALRQALSYLTPHPLTKAPVVLQADELRQAVETISAALATVAPRREMGEAPKDRLSNSDQLRIAASYYREKLPAGFDIELLGLADEWDDELEAVKATALARPVAEEPGILVSPNKAIVGNAELEGSNPSGLAPAPKANGVGTGEVQS